MATLKTFNVGVRIQVEWRRVRELSSLIHSKWSTSNVLFYVFFCPIPFGDIIIHFYMMNDKSFRYGKTFFIAVHSTLVHNQTKREQLFIVVPLLHWIFREFKSSVWTWLMRDFQSHFQNPAWGLQSVITADIKKIAHIKNSWSTRTKRSIFCSILRTLKFVLRRF